MDGMVPMVIRARVTKGTMGTMGTMTSMTSMASMASMGHCIGCRLTSGQQRFERSSAIT
jgi:hypothetical protein